MLKPLNNISIKRKIITITMFMTVVGLSLASMAFIFIDRESTRQSMQQELSVLAQVIAQRSAAAVAFQDRRTAAANLGSLKAKKSIELACIYDSLNQVFSSYLSDERSPEENVHQCPVERDVIEGGGFHDGYLEVYSDINLNGLSIGSLFIKANTDALTQRLYSYAKLSALIILIVLAVVLILSARLQRYISQPILSLATMMVRVKDKNDYSLRVKKMSNDEVGFLVDSFNGMLSTIEEAKARVEDLISELRQKKAKSDANALSAEQKSKAISEFFAGASHDLRQPLHAMGMFSDALKATELAPEQKDLINKLGQSIDNMSGLFSDLLDLSRLDAELPKANFQQVKIADLFEKVKMDFQVVADNKGLGLHVQQTDACVKSDPVMLERIVRNLVSNAIRYTPHGSVSMLIQESDDQIDIQVKDTGVGIPKEKQKLIFESYMQIEDQHGQFKSGLGLGLSIVKKLAYALKADIRLASSERKGSCFSICLPRCHQKSFVANLTGIDAVAHNESLQQPFKQLTFLVIDDEADILKAMSVMISQWGAKALCASSIDEALVLLDDQGITPAAIISDYFLSETETGLDAIQKVSEFLDEDVPAIMITGHTNEQDLKRFEQYQFPVLHKPLKPAQLRISISNLLGI